MTIDYIIINFRATNPLFLFSGCVLNDGMASFVDEYLLVLNWVDRKVIEVCDQLDTIKW